MPLCTALAAALLLTLTITRPFAAVSPGDLFDARTFVVGWRSPDHTGRLLITTVHTARTGLLGAITGWLDGKIDVAYVGMSAPSPTERSSMQRALFDSARAAAAASGARSTPVHPRGFRGASAGLMLALALVERAGDTDLARGRVVAGSGAITPTGKVLPVLQIGRKVIAAERAGADLFLAPSSQAEVARRFAGRMRVIGVGTLDEAVRALAASAGPVGRRPGHWSVFAGG